MFEKDTGEIAKDIYIHHFDDDVNYPEVLKAITVGVQKGVEFGYNKANEWHYVKDKLPQEMQEVIICIKDEKRLTRAKRIKNDLWTSPREDFNTKEIIAWKEIVLPELKEK